jgi:CHASE2 domain-containing sensor protein
VRQTDWRQNLELVVKVLVGVLGVIAGSWAIGWVLRLIGTALIGLAVFLVAILKFLVPVAVLAALVYFGVRALRPLRAESEP